VRFEIVSQTSIEIQRGLDDFQIDVGVTYLDNDPLARVRTVELYRERYVLITHRDGPFAGRHEASWAQAAGLPLCLLTPSMQNRRILDAYFRAAGAEVQAMIETNSLITLWSHLRFGKWSTVVPHTFLLLLGHQQALIALPLIEPTGAHTLGLMASSRDPLTPMTQALLAFARQFDLSSAIEQEIGRAWNPGYQ
jgi:DNA-binding transcriptional LysR family regulator